MPELPKQFGDGSGVFLEGYQFAETIGHPLGLQHTNTSVSCREMVRGIHLADVLQGQAGA